VRPADGNETALAWAFALTSKKTPTALALSRQNLPIIAADLIPPDAIERGAYVLREGADAILIGSGSEVSLCLEAADQLAATGIEARVVSMPCMDRFAEQPRAYRDEVLPPHQRARVAVEAASPFGWDRWTGDRGAIVAMQGFGTSGPGDEVFKHFGFTPGVVADRVREVLAQGDE